MNWYIYICSHANLMTLCRDDFYPKALDTVRQYFKPEEAKVIVDITGREYYVSYL